MILGVADVLLHLLVRPPGHMLICRGRLNGVRAYSPHTVHSSANDHSVFLNTSNVPNFSLLILLSFSLSDSSAYAFGRRWALESASEHSIDAEPWPVEVLLRGSQRARAGGCRLWVLARVVGAHLLSLVGHPGDREPKSGLCQHHQQLSLLPLYHLYLSFVTPY